MIRKLDKVRAGGSATGKWATVFPERWERFIRAMDKRWFNFLGVVHRWTVRQAEAHCRREKERRFQRLFSWQNHHLN